MFFEVPGYSLSRPTTAFAAQASAEPVIPSAERACRRFELFDFTLTERPHRGAGTHSRLGEACLEGVKLWGCCGTWAIPLVIMVWLLVARSHDGG